MRSDTCYTLDDINFSLLSGEERRLVMTALQNHGAAFGSLTPSQKLRVYGLSESSLQALKSELAERLQLDMGKKSLDIRSCPGPEDCKYAFADSRAIGKKLEALVFDTPFPHKVKVAIAGCAMCCSEPYVRDIGLMAASRGWSVLFGGNAAGRPRIADTLAENLAPEVAVSLVRTALDFYRKNASPKQRTARFIEKIGIIEFKKAIGLSNTESS